ncbi:PREDICTED: uncharacterized protein LOC106723788 isoform X1 [Myotis brandtii]|uniref:uncharacterized protein LOC106723788 isoform X1 n=2 Tax=Myotis brandtii TaxID=109478 RepID=UPI0007040B26|nr:PREDICTED: uncharacterized protein LOC106723788 isoform X1 [Myotis brandtii]
MGLEQVSLLIVVNTGLAQVSPQVLDNMGPVQVRLLVMANMDLAQVSPLMANMDLAQVSPLVMANMDLAQVSLLAMANMGQVQLSLLALTINNQVQDTPLALENVDLVQVNLLALTSMGLKQANPAQNIIVEEGDLVTVSPVAVNGILEAHRDTQGPVMARLMDSQETPTNMGRQVMGIPHSQDLAEVEEGDLVTVRPVAVNGILEAHRDTQGPVMARLTDSQETPTNMGRQVMGIPHSQDLAEVEEGDLVTVRPVAVNGILEAHRDTQGPVMARLTDSQETPTNMGRQVMGIPHSQDLAEVEEGDLVTVRPVAVNGILEAHRDTQGPVMARLTDSQETPTNMGRQVMGIPHSQDLAEVEEGDLVTVRPVAVNGILEAHRDTQGPVMARLTDSQETPTNMGRQVMGIPHSQDLAEVEEGDLVTVRPVAVNGILEAHRDTQGPVMARLTDSQETPTNMGRQVMGIPHSQDLAEVEEGDLVTVRPVAVNGILEAHRDTQGPVMARLTDSQETPTNMGRQVMGIPHSQDLAEVEEGDLVTVRPVAVNGILEAHRDTQGPVMARLTDSQETPTNMGRQVMGIPHSQDLAEVEEGDLVTVRPVAVNGILEAHRDTQGPVMARLTDSQETPTNMGRQVMGIPHSQDLAEVEEGDLVTVRPVAVNGILEAHRDTQGPVMARLTDSQETPTNMGRQVMGIPHSQDLAEVEEGDLVTVRPVAVNGILEAHRDTQGPVMARLTNSQETPTNMGRQQEDKIVDQVKDGDTVAMDVEDMTMGNLGMDLQGVVEQAVTILALLGQ